MVKCRICGKRFETVAGLREHYRAIHPKELFVTPKRRFTKRVLVVFIVFLVATGSIVGYLIYSQAVANSSTHSGILNSPISSSLYQDVTGVNYSTLASIGYQQSTDAAPTQIPGSTVSQLLFEDKPEVLYIGAEWCPYCAAERWALVVALSKFGSFTRLEYMLSATGDGNLSTFSFVNATYSSPYISFVSVEHEDRNQKALQSVSPYELDLWDQYTSSTETIPFIYIDAQYYLTTSQFNPVTLSGLNWTQIGSQLNNPNSNVAKEIDGAANQLMGAICVSLQSRNWPEPQSVCTQPFANVSYKGNSSGIPIHVNPNLLPGGTLQISSSQPYFIVNRFLPRLKH